MGLLYKYTVGKPCSHIIKTHYQHLYCRLLGSNNAHNNAVCSHFSLNSALLVICIKSAVELTATSTQLLCF